jgi:hypothetical protein
MFMARKTLRIAHPGPARDFLMTGMMIEMVCCMYDAETDVKTQVREKLGSRMQDARVWTYLRSRWSENLKLGDRVNDGDVDEKDDGSSDSSRTRIKRKTESTRLRIVNEAGGKDRKRK